MHHYQVGTKFINNPYLALHESWKTGHKVHFYLNDFEYDMYNWSQEPEPSLDFLMSHYAQQLRDRHEVLILCYSGGTDSQTIYNIFKQNNIHIDEIVIKTDKISRHLPKKTADWLRKNHWDPTTVITEIDAYDETIKIVEVGNEDWIWDNKGYYNYYSVNPSGDGMLQRHNDKYGGKDYRVITGVEKPRLVYRNKHWYHRQASMTFNSAMGEERNILFFMEPLIAIKQAHMCKRSVKNHIASKNLPLYDGDWAEAKWEKNIVGYRDWCTGTGRHEELFLGVSLSQKETNEVFEKENFSLNGSWKNLGATKDQNLSYHLEEGFEMSTNYVKGFNSLTSEFGFVQWLKDNGWLRESEKELRRLNFIWSKEYDLGP